MTMILACFCSGPRLGICIPAGWALIIEEHHETASLRNHAQSKSGKPKLMLALLHTATATAAALASSPFQHFRLWVGATLQKG